MAYLIAAATFALVVGIIFGAYWLVVLRAERAVTAAVRRRLQAERAIPAVRAALLKEVERLSSLPALNKLLSRQTQLVGPLQRLIQESGLRVTPGVIILATACLGLFVYLAVYYYIPYAIAGLAFGAIAATLPVLWVRYARTRRMRKFEAVFPEAIGLITRALRAGHAFTTGIAMVAEEIPEPVGNEFRLLYDQQNYGLPLSDALRDFSRRVPLIDARIFVTAVLTQRDAGGNLAEVLENLSSVIRDRVQVRREVRVKSAHGRMTAVVLSLMPPVVAGVMLIISPQQMSLLLTDPLGIRMLVGAAVLQLIGVLFIRKIIKTDY
jgi:tight adherence protein B